MTTKKPGRNDPCPCGSGKKFKKCCETQLLKGKFRVTKIEMGSRATGVSSSSAGGLSSLFQSATQALPSRTVLEEDRPLRPPTSFSDLPKVVSEDVEKEIEGKD